ncbi:MAG: hypothetical protein OEU26_21525 [Candidatus Tectomicrobia bacterium]|nr:hypothetical protein [Candidatus Tectomicrobia bacterium]
MKPIRMLTIFLAALAALILTVAPQGWTEDDDGEIPFDEANVFFELNDTDGDLGIHALIDGEAWKQLKIFDPNEKRMLGIWVNGNRLRRQGLTEIFFESAEPTFDELSAKAFFRRFPEGEYEVEGLTLDNQELESETQVSHLLPAPPDDIKISGHEAAEDCEEGDIPSVSGPVVISWEPVTHSHPDLGRRNESIEVVKYQVVVEREEPTLLIFSIDLPPSVTEIEVPAEFIALGNEFKFEILVREASGNQTAVESCFETD